MSDCNSSCVPVGPRGLAGADGAQGEYGGFASNWLYSASTASGTSATELRFDNATMASVTGIYVNDTNADSTDLSGFLASFSNSSNFGLIRIFKESDSNVFAMFTLTAVTDSGSEYDYTVTYIDHNGTFAQGDSLVMEFVPRGTNASGSVIFETFIDLSLPGGFSGTETLIPGATYTFTEAGTYQIHISASMYLRTATPSADTIMNWYLDAVEKQSKKVITSTGDSNLMNVFPNFVWRGTVTEGQVLEVRGILGTGSAEARVDELSILINKEV